MVDNPSTRSFVVPSTPPEPHPHQPHQVGKGSVHRTTFPTLAHAHRAIVRYIEMFYNRKRLHSGLGYKTPAEVHAEYEELQAVT
uniref:IS3 family transposase n=1 Tax=Streptomyces noursei TaxID=1971 RepID=UPI0035E3D1DC